MSAAAFQFDVTGSGPIEVNAPAQAQQFRYDALETKDRRRASSASSTRREDTILIGHKRTQLQGTTQDIVRNFSVAAWAIRRHLDYVARFNFQALTPDEKLNDDIEELMQIQSRPYNMEIGGRFNRERFFRLVESTAVQQGDTGLVLLKNGQVQGIESDLIRDPPQEQKSDGSTWVDGVRIGAGGRGLAYSIFGRGASGGGYEYKTIVPARNFIHYGFFERYASEQIRGVSPIVASLNQFRDVYDNIDYGLIKLKISQLFAIALMRDKDATPMDEVFGNREDDCEGCEEGEDSQDATPPAREINLANGPAVLDLDDGEKVEVIESKTPSDQMQNFSRLVMMVALKALDIPYCFFDESHTNYSGSRGSWLQYQRAAWNRQEEQIEMRRRWTYFQLAFWMMEGLLTLPSGMSIGDIAFEWHPTGMPWWNPADEVEADQEAVASCFESPIAIVKQKGSGDIYRNIDERAKVEAYAKRKGVELRWGKQVITEAAANAQKQRRRDRNKEQETKPT